MSATLDRRREHGFRSPTPSPPRADTTQAGPAAPSTPVQIPIRPKSRDAAHPQKPHRTHGDKRNHSLPRRPRDVHSRDAIPASVAALLAVTSIPPPKATRSLRQTKAEKRMTVESIIERAQESEKQLSLKLCRGPMDILLMAPEDLEADDSSVCDSISESVLSTQTISMESAPSLSNSFTTDTLSSLESPLTPPRRRKVQPTRRSLEPVSSPPGALEDHPLSSPDIEVAGLDFRAFEDKEEVSCKRTSRLPFQPLKFAFKSNLTASLRALRQAARSFSNLNFSSIPPEDFLTRSLLTIDPQVPYTDERRPPPLEEEPTAALRRYLNPTTTARLEKPQATAPVPALRTFTASIQMQTYKVHRARNAPPAPGRLSKSAAGPTAASQSPQPQSKSEVTEHPMPKPRQREVRENPDFIRIAVLEMAMQRNGKLDDQRPGRARWTLPPRRDSMRPYEIRPDGVPVRWVAVTH
ncbi:hypothetical protein NEMBOFW57_000733 [Staphylotrichum longicolle]|uniref:Uncharacterized protein n=1 Tax=Staphylotrichum longicolle TaxID=669026 RepID=A0AAD4I1Z2_9PEZI|nr:hypothetical protein NEMBOFW57_000733 [Staphylotrichum longicolle]